MFDKSAADYTAELPNGHTMGVYHGIFLEWIDDRDGVSRAIKTGYKSGPLNAHISELYRYGVHSGRSGDDWMLYETAAEALAEASTLLIPAPSTELNLPNERGARIAHARLAEATYGNEYDYTAQLAELRNDWNLDARFCERAKHAGCAGQQSDKFEQFAHELLAE